MRNFGHAVCMSIRIAIRIIFAHWRSMRYSSSDCGSIIPLLEVLAHQEVVRRGSETQARQHRANGLALRYFRERSVCTTGSVHTAEEGSAHLLGIGFWGGGAGQDGGVPRGEENQGCVP